MRYGQCFWCARQGEVETHHIFRCVGGASRTKSDRLGLTVDLCHECHQTGRDAVHRCADTDRELKRFGQKKAMLEQDWTKEDFIREFGRNYLTDEDLALVEELREDAALREELAADFQWVRETQLCPAGVRGFRLTAEVMPF